MNSHKPEKNFITLTAYTAFLVPISVALGGMHPKPLSVLTSVLFMSIEFEKQNSEAPYITIPSSLSTATLPFSKRYGVSSGYN